MAETIESFVQKLQADGVQAGQQEAEKIRQAARQQADETLRQAKQEAEKIVAEARAQAEDTLARSRTELQLAARDAALKLRDALSRALEAVLTHGARDRLTDVSFLGQVLHDLVMLYARSQLAGETEPLILNVPPEMRDKLKQWALAEVGRERVDSLRHAFDLKGTLAAAGFEYKATDATVEVTLDSVVQALKELVSPDLQAVLDQALAEKES